MSICEISLNIPTDDAVNATVNPRNTPMAWDFTNIFFFFGTGGETVQTVLNARWRGTVSELAADRKGLIYGRCFP